MRVLTATSHRPFLPRRALPAEVAGRFGLAATFGPVARVDCAADSVFELTKEGEHTVAAGAAQEIDLLSRDQTFPKNVQKATEGRCSRALRPPCAGRTLQRLFDVSS
jgi:hypothetical protein